jgi:hypothetical protein
MPPMRRSLSCLVLAGLMLPAAALAHSEREAKYPPGTDRVAPPAFRTGGPTKVVCKKDSRKRIERLNGKVERRNLRLLRRCKFHHIQAAVTASKTGHRILVLPGVYREKPSRRVPYDDPNCAGMTEQTSDGHTVPSYEYQLQCPNARNLIAVIGDTDGDRICDQRCDLQIEGTGRQPSDVYLKGDKTKSNAIRGDRADGLALRNFKVEFSDENNIYVMETDGFVFDKIVTGKARRYGILTFTSDHGLYDRIDAYKSGDSGVYPGSGGPGDCMRYAIEVRRVNSHGNIMGYSGTAGSNVWVHDNKFHDNAAGIITDSFAAGHPGMPQHCARWENNEIYSNNLNPFTDDRDAYCKETPYKERDLDLPCPTFQVPVGTGGLIAGGNKNIVRNNVVYDNWRWGFGLFYVPSEARGEPGAGVDTSHENQFLNNKMGVRADGSASPNGKDFWWDEQGRGNCWDGNEAAPGKQIKSESGPLPACPGSPVDRPPHPRLLTQAPCVTWDPDENPNPPGCDWFTTPPRPTE